MSDPHSPAEAVAAAEEEPQTPPWIPALGAVLFIGAAIVWAGISAASHGAPQEGAASAVSAAPSAPPALAAAPPPPPPTPPPPPMPPAIQPAAAPPSTAMAAAQPGVRAGAALSAGAAGQGRPKTLPRKPGGSHP